MRYSVEAAGMTLVHSELLERDEGMGVAAGSFVPGPDYAKVQHIFRLFTESNAESSADATDEEMLARYYAAREALGLRLLDPGGREIGTTWIHIVDYSVELGPEALEIDVTITDPAFWRPFPTHD
ncbi:MAG: hypothetical protein M3Z10_01185 [Gemmatimonadota bacterium]|nr:hypothetical protein [Gemmatimonadota bacterium]